MVKDVRKVNRYHNPDKCSAAICCIHNPSDHHMIDWKQLYRYDRGIMERICDHGVGHPDPDDLRIRLGQDSGVHGCDGCCVPGKLGTWLHVE